MAEKESLLHIIDLLKDTQAEVSDLLKNDQHLQVSLNSQFDRMINRIAFMTNTGTVNSLNNPANFKPVTEVLGKTVAKPAKVKPRELTPKEEEIKRLNAKVDKLQGELPNMKTGVILESYINDPVVLRALAKRAGMENYKDGKIDTKFVEDIRAGLKEQEEIAGLKKKDQENLV